MLNGPHISQWKPYKNYLNSQTLKNRNSQFHSFNPVPLFKSIHFLTHKLNFPVFTVNTAKHNSYSIAMSSCSAGLHYSNSPLGVSARCSGCWNVKDRNLANQIKKVHCLGKGRWWLWKYLNICLFLFSMFEYFACMNMYALHACLVCKQARGWGWIPWKCTYRELLVPYIFWELTPGPQKKQQSS